MLIEKAGIVTWNFQGLRVLEGPLVALCTPLSQLFPLLIRVQNRLPAAHSLGPRESNQK